MLCFFKVGLLGMGRTLQRDLNRIAEAADTSTPEGLSFVLQGNDIYRLILHGYITLSHIWAIII